MKNREIQFGDVAIFYSNTADESSRAEHISRLTMEYVQQLLEREMQQVGADVDIERLNVPPILVSFETMSDEDIARASADRICQMLMQTV